MTCKNITQQIFSINTYFNFLADSICLNYTKIIFERISQTSTVKKTKCWTLKLFSVLPGVQRVCEFSNYPTCSTRPLPPQSFSGLARINGSALQPLIWNYSWITSAFQ